MKKCMVEFKSVFLSLGFIICSTSMMAQSGLTLEASQFITTFKFKDSLGIADKSYSGNYSGAYSFGYRYNSTGGLMFRVGMGMRKGGATMVYDNTSYAWNLQYADVKVGIGYIFTSGRFQPYFTASPYYAFLLKATQSLNNQNFDMMKSRSLKTSDYGVFITPGLQFKASDAISLYTEFNYIMGLQNLETRGGKKSYNRAYGLTLGVTFTITQKSNK